MKRASCIRPGFDKRADGGGIHCDEWQYSVVTDDGRFAVSVTVFSDCWPDSVGFRLGEGPRASDLTFHSSFATSRDQLDASRRRDCPLLPEGCLIYWSSSLAAAKLFDQVGAAAFEQPEGFWLELERRLAEKLAEAKLAAGSMAEGMIDSRAHYCARCLDPYVTPAPVLSRYDNGSCPVHGRQHGAYMLSGAVLQSAVMLAMGSKPLARPAEGEWGELLKP